MFARSIGFGSVLALAAALAACGGGGGGGAPSGPREGVAVDPYVLGAVLQELTPAGALVQESSPSDALGAFRFPGALHPGNRVAMVVKGVHNGTPYPVSLAAEVPPRGALVVSPLTTLIASGAFTADSAAALIRQALPGSSVGAQDVLADPMSRVLDGDAADADRRLLAGNIAVGAALAITHGDAGSPQLPALVAAIAPRVLAALSLTGSPEAVASAAAAVAAYVAAVSTTAAEAAAAAGAITDGLLAELVAAAAGGRFAAIVVAGGALQAGTSAATVEAHLGAGHAALDRLASTRETDALLTAVNEFSTAAALADTDASATAARKDEAFFYAGLARVAALAQPYSDATDDGLDDLGALFDAYGLGGTNADRASFTSYAFLECEDVLQPGTGAVVGQSCHLKQLPASAPKGRALQAFAMSRLSAGLRGALALLDRVSPSFVATRQVAGEPLELDATDVQLARTVALGMLAVIEVQYAYDLDVDLSRLQALAAGEGSGGGVTQGDARRLARFVAAPVRALAPAQDEEYGPRQFLADYPSFLRLVSAPSLRQARGDALDACASALATLDLLEAETDDPSDDFFRVGGERCEWSPEEQEVICSPIDASAEIAEVRARLEEVRAVLSDGDRYTFDMGTADPADDVVIAPARFFAGIDLRAKLPAFDAGASGAAPGMFPDPTFGGFLVSSPFALDSDVDHDGSPDVFGFSYFFPEYLAGNTYWSSGYVDGSLYGTFALDRAGNGFTFEGFVLPDYGPAPAEYAGTYGISGNVLTLTFGGAIPGDVSRMVVTADELQLDGTFYGEVEYRDAAGQTLVTQWQSFHPEEVRE